MKQISRCALPVLVMWMGALVATAGGQDEPPPETTPLQDLRAEAEAVRPLVASDLAKRFLAATADLPAIETARVLY